MFSLDILDDDITSYTSVRVYFDTITLYYFCQL